MLRDMAKNNLKLKNKHTSTTRSPAIFTQETMLGTNVFLPNENSGSDLPFVKQVMQILSFVLTQHTFALSRWGRQQNGLAFEMFKCFPWIVDFFFFFFLLNCKLYG